MERIYVAYLQSTRPKIADSTFSLTTQFVNKYMSTSMSTFLSVDRARRLLSFDSEVL